MQFATYLPVVMPFEWLEMFTLLFPITHIGYLD